MKKIIFFSASLLLFTAASAEELQFVTTISPPVGSFAHLDAADSTHVTSAPILNFCNTRSSAGKIAIKGAGAYLKQIDIQNGTALGSTNTPEYRLGEKLTIEKGGTVTAGRVMANQVTFDDTNYHKSNVTNTLYGKDVAVMGGKTDNMEISSTAKINKSAQKAENLGVELWWDNQYKNDYDASGNKKTNGKTYTSFLLKSKSTQPSCDIDCGFLEVDEATCTCKDSYSLQYRALSFATSGNTCYGKTKFYMAKGDNLGSNPYVDYSPSSKLYDLDSKIKESSYHVLNLSGRAIKDLIYQCVFTEDVHVRPYPCDDVSGSEAMQKCWQETCESVPTNTVFIKSGSGNYPGTFTNGGRSIYAMQYLLTRGPQDKGQYYCMLQGEYGPPFNSNGAGGNMLRPCIGFASIQFFACLSQKDGWLFKGFVDDSQQKWSSNKKVQILP